MSRAAAVRSEPYSWAELRRLIHPASVALVGASPTPGSFGDNVLKNCARYEGELFLVNPGYEQIGERPCFKSLGDLPSVPDCVVVAIKRELVLGVLEECAALGVGGAVVFASGFAELGPEGRAEQDALAALCRRSGLRMWGPNTSGPSNFVNGAVLTFSPEMQLDLVRPGAVGVVSQSGAVGYAPVQARRRGVNISHALICGNSADLDVADGVSYLAGDPACAAIACMLEGLETPRRLVLAARKAREAGKPLVVFKAARGKRGAEAAASHTGAMAGDHALYVAALEAEGAVIVAEPEALIDTAAFLAKTAAGAVRPRGGETAILTASGGWGIVLADEAEDAGVPLPPLPEAAREVIAGIIPPFGSAANPCDVTAQILSNRPSLSLCANTLLGGQAYDLLVWPQPYVTNISAAAYVDMIDTVGDIAKAHGKLACMVWSTSWLEAPPVEAGERHSHVAVFRSARHCFDAIAAWVRREVRLARLGQAPAPVPAEARARVAALLASGGAMLTERLAKQALAEYGVPVVAERRAASPAEAARAAAEIGLPVALKIDSPDLAHKSDIGAVRLNLNTCDEVEAAAGEVLAAVRHTAPDANIDGLLVQYMLPKGVELLIGARVDPHFGAFVAVGFGGVLAEVIGDIALRPAPVAVAEAKAMLDDLRGRAILDGVRGSVAVNHQSICETISCISTLVSDHADAIAELDVNPLICFADRAVAADALIILAPHNSGA